MGLWSPYKISFLVFYQIRRCNANLSKVYRPTKYILKKKAKKVNNSSPGSTDMKLKLEPVTKLNGIGLFTRK